MKPDVKIVSGKLYVLCNVQTLTRLGDKIEEESLVSKLASTANKLTGSKRGSTFPIAQPLSFKRSFIPKLKEFDYIASLKTDGERVMLLLTRVDGDEPISVLFNRKMEFFKIEVFCNDHFFDGTLIDGELIIEDRKNPVLLAFDCYSISGSSFLLHNYEERIGSLSKKFLDEEDIEDDTLDEMLFETNRIYSPMISLKAKSVWKTMDIQKMYETKHASLHMNDGVIFTPNAPVFANKHVYKFKETHTIDIKIDVDYDGIYIPILSTSTRSTIQPIIVVDKIDYQFHSVTQNTLLQKVFQTNSSSNKIFECVIRIDDANRIAFFPIRYRSDKTLSNSLHVVKETIINVRENVQIEELF